MDLKSRDFDALATILREFDPHKLTSEVALLGEDWADKDAAASCLEESKKTLLAQVTVEFMSHGISGALGEKPKPMPVSQAELRALADPRYEQHLDMMVLARQESNRTRVRYDMGRMRLELMRSLQATMRNEIRMNQIT